MGVWKDIGLRLILNKQVGNHKWKLFHYVRISKISSSSSSLPYEDIIIALILHF